MVSLRHFCSSVQFIIYKILSVTKVRKTYILNGNRIVRKRTYYKLIFLLKFCRHYILHNLLRVYKHISSLLSTVDGKSP